MCGCFGGCTFCSVTEHEGRIIQNRSQESILREIEEMRDNVKAGKPQTGKKMLTQHTGLPPKARTDYDKKPKPTSKSKPR